MTSQLQVKITTNNMDVNTTMMETTVQTALHDHHEELIKPWFKIVVFAAFISTCVVGTIGNLVVTFIIIKRRKIKRVIHFLTLNLAFSDLMVLMIYLPLQLYSINKQLKWELGQVPCRFFYMVNAFTVNASICTLIAITRDRYVAISNPMMTRSRGVASIKCWVPVIWIASFVMTIPLLFVVDVASGYCTESKWTNILFERVYWISIFFIQFVLPLICFVISYSIIIYRFGKSSRLLLQRNAQRRSRSKRRKQKRKLLKMAIMLTVVYIVCSLPQHLVFFAATFEALRHEPLAVYIFVTSNFLMILNSAINPIIYGSQSDEIKREILKFCPCYQDINKRIRDTLRMRGRTTYKANACIQLSVLKLSLNKTVTDKITES